MARKRLPRTVLALLLGFALLSAACGSDSSSAPTVDNDDGLAMVTEFVETIASNDTDAIGDMLSDGYQSQHADGTGDTKAEVLADPSELRSWEIGTDTDTTQHRDYAVVRWTLTIDSTIHGVEFGQDANPRLTTFIWEDDRWRVSSHANFNVPDPRSTR